MKTVFILLAFTASTSAAMADNYVNGYYRQNGTYVQPHYQTAPDATPYNNYSTKGNTNPYTGQPGYINPQPVPQPQMNNPYIGQGGGSNPYNSRR